MNRSLRQIGFLTSKVHFVYQILYYSISVFQSIVLYRSTKSLAPMVRELVYLAGPGGFGRKTFKIWTQCNWKAGSSGREVISLEKGFLLIFEYEGELKRFLQRRT
jgi:hypothetical protein